MKKNGFSTLLEGALAFSVLFSVFMCIRLIVHSRDLRMYQHDFQNINTRNLSLEALVNDCREYSRQNPAIDPILLSINVNPNPAGRGAR